MNTGSMLYLVRKTLLFLLVSIPLLEISIRIFEPQQIITADDIYLPDGSGLGIRLAPGIDRIINTGEGEARIITDEDGFRVSEDIQEGVDIKILALGDSFLLAMQVDYDETMTAILERNLSSRLGKNVRIVNTGVGAYSPSHYLILERRELKSREYALVLVFVYLGNDLIDAPVAFFDPVIRTSRKFHIPERFSRSEIVDGLLYPINDLLEKHSHLYVLLKNQLGGFLAKIGLTARYFPDNLMVSSSGKEYWDVTANILAEMEFEASRYDIPVVYVLLPSSYQVISEDLAWARDAFGISDAEIDLRQPSERMFNELNARELMVLDMYQPLRDAYLEQTIRPYGTVDSHLSKDGHEIVADALLDPVLQILMDYK